MTLRWLPLLVISPLVLAGCGTETASCALSKPMKEGASTKVVVEVATKDGLGVNIMGSIDVNGGRYLTPVKEIGSETDLPVGTYDGTVTNRNGDLTLDVEGQTLPLSGPESCD